ncbi:glycosyltransferase family 2 protein [Flavobacteriaceae bacterium]|nr:glycosyltransferase family A protein [Algibacter sp.]MDA9069416.1 glycosyltransferase family 2 protein [Algibacter sp.]MDB9859407.1 glycosyltransferase family 2 protein [Flavobacteriaceae bacterium]
MKFSVSVIIPVYNCESFIEKAIESVLLQSEVFEIIVVNDGSTDDSLSLIEALQKEDDRIKIYHHKNAINKGRSATRNLGIQKATGNYIAFLDADDYYLSNRFENDKKIFSNDSKCDGVYSAVSFHFYRETKAFELPYFKLNTVTQLIKSDNLFEALISGKYGYIHLNGLTLKKSVFNDVGLFNEALIVAEDSDLIFKIALKCQLQPSIIDVPLAQRGIHDNNVFNRGDLYQIYNIKMYESVFIWSGKNKIPLRKVDILLKWIWILNYKEKKTLLGYIKHWSYLFYKTPKWFFTYLSLKYFPIVRLRQKLFSFLYANNRS